MPTPCRAALTAWFISAAVRAENAPAQADVGVELVVTSAGPPTPRTCYAAPGVPAYAKGAFIIAGPARFEVGSYKFQAIFDGFGRVNRFEMSEGQVCYTSQWLNTDYARTSNRTGMPPQAILFEDTKPARPSCPWNHPMCSLSAMSDNNWVNSIVVENEVLLLSDTPLMVRMDLETLNVSGYKTWADDKKGSMGKDSPSWIHPLHVGAVGSAHPLKRPGTNSFVDILDEQAMLPLCKTYLDVYTFEASSVGLQNRKKVGSIATNGVQYLHSFGVTPNYVVLPFDLGMKINPLNFRTMMGSFEGAWSGVHIMDLEGNSQVFETDKFFHVHIANTFENATGVVMDIGVYNVLPFERSPLMDIFLFLNKTARDADLSRAGIRRLHFHLSGPSKGNTTYEDFSSPHHLVDFFKINPAYQGLPYCIYYAMEWFHDGKTMASHAILKHDLCKGTKLYWNRADTYLSEPSFVAQEPAGAEDDGIVVFVALDGHSRRSQYVVLDARTMKEVSVVKLPVHIPFLAHGNFIPAARKGAAEAEVQIPFMAHSNFTPTARRGAAEAEVFL